MPGSRQGGVSHPQQQLECCTHTHPKLCPNAELSCLCGDQSLPRRESRKARRAKSVGREFEGARTAARATTLPFRQPPRAPNFVPAVRCSRRAWFLPLDCPLSLPCCLLRLPAEEVHTWEGSRAYASPPPPPPPGTLPGPPSPTHAPSKKNALPPCHRPSIYCAAPPWPPPATLSLVLPPRRSKRAGARRPAQNRP